MSRCTVPTLLCFGEWYNHNFGDLCLAHDDAYVEHKNKLKADWVLCSGIWKRGYKVFAVGTMFFCLTVGSWFWVRRWFR